MKFGALSDIVESCGYSFGKNLPRDNLLVMNQDSRLDEWHIIREFDPKYHGAEYIGIQSQHSVPENIIYLGLIFRELPEQILSSKPEEMHDLEIPECLAVSSSNRENLKDMERSNPILYACAKEIAKRTAGKHNIPVSIGRGLYQSLDIAEGQVYVSEGSFYSAPPIDPACNNRDRRFLENDLKTAILAVAETYTRYNGFIYQKAIHEVSSYLDMLS